MSFFLCKMLVNLKNAQKSKNSFMVHRKTSLCSQVLNILWDANLILGYKVNNKNQNYLVIFLKYNQNEPVITKLENISLPSRRVYLSVKEIWKLDSNLGLFIFATNKGVLSSKCCKRLNIGGELLAFVN